MESPALKMTPDLREIQTILSSDDDHWVGDGFFVRTVFDPSRGADMLSPFILLDHGARRYFGPSQHRRGVGENPHRGFETVTFAYEGEIEHRDSSGGGWLIGPGDVQWMTAASGVVHEEIHSERFSQQGGEFEVAQLWINLPAQKKMSQPGYQPLVDRQFPRVEIGSARARVIAGSVEGTQGPAKTHTPMTLFDLRFMDAGHAELNLPSDWTTLVVALEGNLHGGAHSETIPDRNVAVFERGSPGAVRLQGDVGARALVLSGEPIHEPVVAQGPFVMNTKQEILEAFRDYQTGKMGRLR